MFHILRTAELGHRTPMSIDITDSKVYIAHIDWLYDHHSLLSYGSIPLAQDSVVDGVVQNPEKIVEAIQYLLGTTKPYPVETKRVALTLPGNKSFVRMLSLTGKEKSIQQTVEEMIPSILPMAKEELYYDWSILDPNREGETPRVLFVAVPKKVADTYMQVVQDAGLKLITVEVRPLARAYGLVRPANKWKSLMLLDIGRQSSEASFWHRRAVYGTTHIPFSFALIVDAIAKKLKVSYEEAHEILMEKGIGSWIDRDPVFEAIEPLLRSLVQNIRSVKDFFTSKEGYAPKVDSMIISSQDGLCLSGLDAYLASVLHIPVERGNAWSNMLMQRPLPFMRHEESIQFATAFGLSIKSLRDEGRQPEMRMDRVADEEDKEKTSF